MNSVKVARAIAVATAIIWTVKSLVIWQAGGLDKSDAEAPLFVLGLVACLAAWAAIAIAATQGRAMWLRILAGVGGLGVGLVLVLIFDAIAGAVVPDSAGWFQEEAGLLAAAFVTVLVAFGLLGRRRVDAGSVAP